MQVGGCGCLPQWSRGAGLPRRRKAQGSRYRCRMDELRRLPAVPAAPSTLRSRRDDTRPPLQRRLRRSALSEELRPKGGMTSLVVVGAGELATVVLSLLRDIEGV